MVLAIGFAPASNLKKYRIDTSTTADAHTAKAQEKFQDCIITCDYAEGEERLTQRSAVSFEWYVKASGYEEKLTIQLKCENASARGVRFPESWNTSIECARLGKAKIESSIEELKKVSSLSQSISFKFEDKIV